MKQYNRPVYVLQVAQLGGPGLGAEDDPEGAWIDHDVFLDRDLAEAEAKLHETGQWFDDDGRDISADIATVARVITFTELEQEFGADRMHRARTMFNDRIVALMKDLPSDE
jgi:hypothetical protein